MLVTVVEDKTNIGDNFRMLVNGCSAVLVTNILHLFTLELGTNILKVSPTS